MWSKFGVWKNKKEKKEEEKKTERKKNERPVSGAQVRRQERAHGACGTLMDVDTQIPSCSNLTRSPQTAERVVHLILVDLERL